MYGIKPSVMTVLAGLVVATAGTSAALQAQEISNHRSSLASVMPTLCLVIPGSSESCLSSSDNILGLSGYLHASHNWIWQMDHLSQVDAAVRTPLFTLQDNTCEKWQNSPRSSLTANEPDPISLTRYLTFDFEMDDINRFELSSLSVGFRNCW